MADKTSKGTGKKAAKTTKPSAPPAKTDFFSLISNEALSGPRAQAGFTDQSGYALLRALEWVEDTQFLALEIEGHEDVDVRFFDQGKMVFDYHQVKNYPLKPADIVPYLVAFMARRASEPDHVRNLVLAAPPGTKDTEVEKLKMKLEPAKKGAAHPLATVRKQTTNALRTYLGSRRTKLDAYTTIFLECVEFYDQFEGLTKVHSMIERLANALGRLAAYQAVSRPTLERITWFMLARFHLSHGRLWSKQDVLDELEQALGWFNATRKEPVPNVFIVRQWSVDRTRPFDSERTLVPARNALKIDANDDRLIRQVTFAFGGKGDFPASSAELEPNVTSLLGQLTDPHGTLKAILMEYPDADLLVMGVIEIPFAILTGYLIGSGREVHYFEHDHDRPRFYWKNPDALTVTRPLTWTNLVVPETDVEDAVIVGSVSCTVSHASYSGIVTEPYAFLEFGVKPPQRDVIESEEQLHLYLSEIRGRLHSFLDGLSNLKRVHLFLAVPITMAYGIGKLLKPSDLRADVHVYQYENGRYVWGIAFKPDASPFEPALYHLLTGLPSSACSDMPPPC